jgi:hypothetical protein
MTMTNILYRLAAAFSTWVIFTMSVLGVLALVGVAGADELLQFLTEKTTAIALYAAAGFHQIAGDITAIGVIVLIYLQWFKVNQKMQASEQAKDNPYTHPYPYPEDPHLGYDAYGDGAGNGIPLNLQPPLVGYAATYVPYTMPPDYGEYQHSGCNDWDDEFEFAEGYDGYMQEEDMYSPHAQAHALGIRYDAQGNRIVAPPSFCQADTFGYVVHTYPDGSVCTFGPDGNIIEIDP